MKALLQRVTSASVDVGGACIGKIARGLLVLLAVEKGDDENKVDGIVSKIVNLRVFPNTEGKLDHSVLDVGGSVLLISQFTLAGDCKKGTRPSFDRAADREVARSLYDRSILKFQATGVPLATGSFGALMQVSLVNDGPVTLWIEA